VVFVADDLVSWLVGRLADAGYKKLSTALRGSEQDRALKQAATAAVQATAIEISPSDDERAGRFAVLMSEAFGRRVRVSLLPEQQTMLEGLQAGIAGRLSVLDDAARPFAGVLGVPVSEVADRLTGHLVGEIMIRGSQGGPLSSLADQLNHDLTHLQGQRQEAMLAQLARQLRTLTGVASRPVARQPVRLLPRPAFLAGRGELLAELDARMTGIGADGLTVVALCGLGGAGKTSLALEYAHRHLAELGVAWQFAAEDATVLAAGFAELAAHLGVGAEVGAWDPVVSVHGVLAKLPEEWLLIFDNAADRAAVEQSLPPAGRGRVLVTCRNPNWPPGQVLEVPTLDREVAARFLVSRTGDHDESSAAELADELGGLPLALEQAAAYIRASGGSLAGYLALFRRRRPEMLARGEPTGYSMTVATTWSLAFTQLEESAQQAVALLRLLAWCAPESVPLRLLLRPCSELAEYLSDEVTVVLAPLLEDELAVNDAVVALRRYSLVAPAGDGMVSVHRLVQAVTADQLSEEMADQWQQAAAILIEAAIPDDTDSPQAWPVCAALLPHAQAVLNPASASLERIANYLGERGSYAAARDLLQQIFDACKRVFGPYDDGTLTVWHNLAHWTGQAGDAAGARDQYAALLAVRERVLGPEHPDTLSARASQASWTGRAGDPAEARDQYAALLPVEKGVLGPDHPNVMSTRHELAHWTAEAGDAAGARDQFAALLPVMERVLTPEHPSALSTRHELARTTGAAGDPAGARDQFAELLPIRERVLGPDHEHALSTRQALADWTGEAGEAARARDQYAELLPIRERVLGPDHEDTLFTRHELAYWTGEAGEAAGARDQYAELLPIRERVLGPDHQDTLVTRSELADWTGKAGDPARARDQLAELLPIRERVLGPDHQDTLTTRNNLAHWTHKADSGP
jgi:Tetratricopeptide repeat